MMKDCDFSRLSERDRLTSLFLPENSISIARLSREELDEYERSVFGANEGISFSSPILSEEFLKIKQSTYYSVYFRYARIFDLCKVIGAAHIYDIGCMTINQSFQLVRYSAMSYTGITNNGFILNDYRHGDWDEKNYNELRSEEAPPPFCEGRIRFAKGYYPDFVPEIAPNNIAVSCYGFTICREEEEIRRISSALVRDFDRVLFNIPWHKPELEEMWRSMDWGNFEFFSIGPQGFVFGTKISEDIRRMKEQYPFFDGRFVTGIDDYADFCRCTSVPDDPFRTYAEW